MKKRNVGAEPMSEQRGITLIALIITIIVMMILVGVTVTFTIGENGILKTAKEAKTKTELAQIIEAIGIEKQAIIAENKGVEPASYDIERLIQSVPQHLKEKYIDTNKLFIYDDGQIYYNTNLEDPEEIDYLEELGINAQLTFRAYLQQEVQKIEKDEGFLISVDELLANVKKKYPNTYITSKVSGLLLPAERVDFSTFNFKSVAGYKKIQNVIAEGETAGRISDTTEIPTKTTNVETITNEYIKQIVDITNEYELSAVFGKTVKNLKTILELNVGIATEMSIVFCRDDGNVILSTTGELNFDEIVFAMSEKEACKRFIFNPEDKSEIIAYIGNEKNVVIPQFIYNSKCETIAEITELPDTIFSKQTGADVIPMKISEMMLAGNDDIVDKDKYYLEEMTVADLYYLMMGEDYEQFTSEWPQATSKKPEDKMTVVNKYFEQEGVPIKEYIGVDSNKIPILYFHSGDDVISVPIPMPKEDVIIETVTFGGEILNITDYTFKGLTTLTTIDYRPESTPTIAPNAFTTCTNLTIIKFPYGNLESKIIDGIDTYWGAPNESIKIYDSKGEYPGPTENT